MITTDSRYRDSKVEKLSTTKGTVLTIVAGEQVDHIMGYTYYQWNASDRIDLLAHTYYRDAMKWWIIADGNPEILDWSDVTPGTIVRIPNG